MLNLNNHVKYSKAHKVYIKSLGNTKYEDWDSRKNINKDIKKSIKKQLLFWQNEKCVYCGLKLEETSREEIEHIAPRHLYPYFEYITKNLAMSCQYCNSSSKKGRKDTVLIEGSYYNQCIFNIVHPYLDDVDCFFENEGAIIKVRLGLSANDKEKAEKTIMMFGLSENAHVEARAKQLIYERVRAQYTFDEINEALLDAVSLYK